MVECRVRGERERRGYRVSVCIEDLLAVEIALNHLLIERSLGVGHRGGVDAIANGDGRQRQRINDHRAGDELAALLHGYVTRIVRRGIGRAILIGIIRLVDVLLLL